MVYCLSAGVFISTQDQMFFLVHYVENRFLMLTAVMSIIDGFMWVVTNSYTTERQHMMTWFTILPQIYGVVFLLAMIWMIPVSLVHVIYSVFDSIPDVCFLDLLGYFIKQCWHCCCDRNFFGWCNSKFSALSTLMYTFLWIVGLEWWWGVHSYQILTFAAIRRTWNSLWIAVNSNSN